MKLPAPIVRALLRVHDRAQRTPYFHLPGYMRRYWVFGNRSPERNDDNPRWHGCAGGPAYRWLARIFVIRAHTILRSDNDRHPHDHPCPSISVVLDGGYWEVLEPTEKALADPLWRETLLAHCTRTAVPTKWFQWQAAEMGIHWRGPGAVVFRSARQYHRLILPGGDTKSLFVLGPRVQEWGFLVNGVKVSRREYTKLQGDQDGQAVS